MARHAHPRVLATTLALAFQCAVQAQSQPQEVEKLEITGSRVKRADVEGALPVTVITRQDIEASGQATVAELIRDSPFTTTGNFRPQSGFSEQGTSEVNLRGLGGRRTLVLVDGHRLAKAPMAGGEYVDMNSIPLAAVERIEILTDGASAIYGSDALGGVVNIILRKNFEGVVLVAGQTRVSAPIDGGDRAEASAVLGMVTDKGRILMGASATDREIIYARDAYYTRDLVGASTDSNNYLRASGSFLAPVPGGCANPNFALRPNGRCGYDFRRVAADEAALWTRGFFARGEYDISADWTTFLVSSVSRVTSFGRYAPVPGKIVIEPGSVAHPWHPAYPDPSLRERVGENETILLAHRFAAGGNRDTTQETNLYDVLIGAKGRLLGADVEFGLRKSTSDSSETGRGFVIEPLAREAIRTGTYNIFDPISTPRSVLDSFTHTTSRDGLFDSTEQYANATFDVVDLAGGAARLFVGAEHRKEDFEDIYDSLSEGGAVIGSAGNSAGDTRKVNAIGAELVLPVTRQLEVALAARWEDYSDFGSGTSPKISFRYQPERALVLRGSLGKGFAAPALWQSNIKPAWTAAGVVDERHCLADGNSPDFCEGGVVAVNTYIIGNPELTAEHSTHLSVGGAWDVASFLSVKADFWKTRIEDTIVEIGPQEIADRDSGRSLLPIPSPLSITRDATGFITEIRAGYTNEGTLKQSGVDASVVLTASLGRYGQWRSELTWSRVFAIDNNGVRLEGDFYWPIDRAVLANRWMIGSFDAAWNVKMIGKHGDDRVGHAGSYVTHDVQLAWATPLKGLKVVAGAINVTAKMPPPVGGRPFDFWLYDGYGRQAYARLEMRF